MKWIMIVGLVIMMLALAKSSGTPTGYELTDGFLHTWNQNPIGVNESNIWQNQSSNYMQFFNGEDLDEARERSTWLKNQFAIGRYVSGNFVYYDVEDYLQGATVRVSSDNSTYWNQSITKCITRNCAGWNRKQLVNDTYMENTLWWQKRSGSFAGIYYYVWKLKDINIENDNDFDRVRYCYNEEVEGTQVENCRWFDTNEDDSFEQLNLTKISVYDIDTEQGHRIEWSNNLNVRLRYEGDGNIMLLSPIKNINSQDSIKMYWIDDSGIPCNSGIYGSPYTQLSSIICVDGSNQQTGYILYKVPTYYVYNNTPTLHGKIVANNSIFRAYFGFNPNLTEMPKRANFSTVRIWNGLTVDQPSNNGPTTWKTTFYSCQDCISDNTGLDSTDFGNGNATRNLFIWNTDAPCGVEAPCEAYITLGDREDPTFTEGWNSFNGSFQANKWWNVMYWDFSATSSGQYYQSRNDVYGTPADTTIRTLLNITFELPDPKQSINITVPKNNTEYVGASYINFTGLVGGAYTSDIISLSINASNGTAIYTNTTDVSNGTISWDRLFLNSGIYGVWMNTTDKIGYKNWSGVIYINVTNVTGVPSISIEKKTGISIFPFILLIVMMFIGINKINGEEDDEEE